MLIKGARILSKCCVHSKLSSKARPLDKPKQGGSKLQLLSCSGFHQSVIFTNLSSPRSQAIQASKDPLYQHPGTWHVMIAGNCLNLVPCWPTTFPQSNWSQAATEFLTVKLQGCDWMPKDTF